MQDISSVPRVKCARRRLMAATTSSALVRVSGVGCARKKNISRTAATNKLTIHTRGMERPTKKKRTFTHVGTFVYKPPFWRPVDHTEQGNRGLFRPPILEYERPCGYCEESDCDWCTGLAIR